MAKCCWIYTFTAVAHILLTCKGVRLLHRCPAACHCETSGHVDCRGTGLPLIQLETAVSHLPSDTTFLDLSSNYIQECDASFFKNVPDLLVLNLSYNSMKSCSQDVDQYIPNLKELYMDCNNFKDIPRNLFVNMTSLKILSLKGNKLQDLQRRAFGLPKLKRLILSDNHLVEVIPNQLTGMPLLQELDLSHNYLRTVKPGSLQDVPALRLLDLSFNFLQSLPHKHVDEELMKSRSQRSAQGLLTYRDSFNIFKAQQSLASLYLSGNMLTDLDFLNSSSLAYSLELLMLDDNKLAAVPKGIFPSLKTLRVLSLSKNKITTIISGAFFGNQLDSLSLAYNSLQEIGVDMFEGIRQLRSLDLSNNLIRTAAHYTFYLFARSMNMLDLSCNKLETVNHVMFAGLENLTNLNLSHNSLFSILGGTFTGMTSLNDLDLDNNRLQWLSAEMFEGVPLRRLSVRHNPLLALVRFSPTTGPLTISADLKQHSATEHSITVSWPFHGGSHNPWTRYLWCLSDNSSCPAGQPDEVTFLPKGTFHMFHILRHCPQFYMCVNPNFSGSRLTVHQCGAVKTLPHVKDYASQASKCVQLSLHQLFIHTLLFAFLIT